MNRRDRMEQARDRLVAECARLMKLAAAATDEDQAAVFETRAIQCDLRAQELTREVITTRTWHDSPVVR